MSPASAGIRSLSVHAGGGVDSAEHADRLSVPLEAPVARGWRRMLQDLKARFAPSIGYLEALSLAVLLVAFPGHQSLAQEPTSADRSGRLKVVSWNIHGCISGIQGVIDQLQRLHPDLVCLQEAEVTPEADDVRQPQTIAEALGMRQYSAGSKLPNGREQRMAILFRGDIANPEALDAGTGRIYGVTGLIRMDGTEMRVICLHLTSSYRTEIRHLLRTSAARGKEAQHLAARLRAWPAPIIVAGDFNSTPGMDDHDTVAAGLRAEPTTRPTFPSDHPRLAIDHVYVSPPHRIESRSTPPTSVSDHLPVVALIILGSSVDTATAGPPYPEASSTAPWPGSLPSTTRPGE